MTAVPEDKCPPTSAHEGDLTDAYRRLSEFVQGTGQDRLFRQPISHPSARSGFCYCEHSLIKAVWFLFRAVVFAVAAHCPSSGLRAWILRRWGAQIGANVTISPGVWIDPTFPRLLTFEDNVFIGTGARITTHEYRMKEFRAGRVILRNGALIGGFAILGCGVEIGAGATVAPGALVGRDVPPHATAIGNPMRIIRRSDAEGPTGS